MTIDHTITMLGGDIRQLSLLKMLVGQGLSVHTFGLPCEQLPTGAKCFSDWREALVGACCVVLGLPASADGVCVNLPLVQGIAPLSLQELFAALPHGVMLAGGKFSPGVKAKAEQLGIDLFDYFDSETLQAKNALPTAEGAVMLLMREIPRTVSGLSVGVTGYGRVAKALSDLLLAMGAKVSVAARKEADLAQAAAKGCDTVRLTDEGALLELVKGPKVIFNTVPHWIFTNHILANTPRETLLIDLASAPGGVDASAAASYGIRVIWALSLPGKYAPETAGEIIAQALLEKMREEGLV